MFSPVGSRLGCLTRGPRSLCCHTGESGSFHGRFAALPRAGSLRRGLTAGTGEQPGSDKSQGVARGLYSRNSSVSVGGLTSSSQAETFPSLSREAVAVAASRISRWVKFQRNDDGFDASQMMTAEVLTPPLIPSLNRQGP